MAVEVKGGRGRFIHNGGEKLGELPRRQIPGEREWAKPPKMVLDSNSTTSTESRGGVLVGAARQTNKTRRKTAAGVMDDG